MIKIIINKRTIETEKGANLLKTCLDNGIFIPNLCYINEMETPPVSCRLCFVEIEGTDSPVAACSVSVEKGMIVKTDTDHVRRLQRSGFELLMSNHRIKCGECPSKNDCVLINISRFLKVKLKPKRLETIIVEHETEDHPHLIFDQTKCIMCGKCLYICNKLHGSLYLSLAKRGLETKISFYGETDPEKIPCGKCNACVEICPVSALISYKKYHNLVKK